MAELFSIPFATFNPCMKLGYLTTFFCVRIRKVLVVSEVLISIPICSESSSMYMQCSHFKEVHICIIQHTKMLWLL